MEKDFCSRALVVVCALALTACGGNVGSTPRPQSSTAQGPVVLQGVLMDSPVSGIRYETPSRQGVTTVDGEFDYLEGETVSFFLGALELGSTTGSEVITLFDLVGLGVPETAEAINAGISDGAGGPGPINKVVNLAQLLQSLDADADPSNGIVIETTVADRLDATEFELESWYYEFPYGGNSYDARGLVGLMHEAIAAGELTARSLVTTGDALVHVLDQLEVNIGVHQALINTLDDDADGAVDWRRTFSLDPAGNIVQDDIDTDGDGVSNNIAYYRYDTPFGWNRFEQDSDGDGVLNRSRTISYDNYGRVLESNNMDGSGAVTSFVAYTYDQAGNLVERNNNGTLEFWIVDAAGLRSTYEVDRNGDGTVDERSLLTYAQTQRSDLWTLREIDADLDGVYEGRQERTFDELNRQLTNRLDANGDGVPEDERSWVYGPNGLESYEQTTASSSRRQLYTRDSAGRLLRSEADNDGDGVVDSVQTFDYDAAGNTVQREFDNDGDGTLDRVWFYTYDGDGRQLTFSQDTDGNGQVDSLEQRSYDSEGRLIEIQTDSNADGVVDSRRTYENWVTVSPRTLF